MCTSALWQLNDVWSHIQNFCCLRLAWNSRSDKQIKAGRKSGPDIMACCISTNDNGLGESPVYWIVECRFLNYITKGLNQTHLRIRILVSEYKLIKISGFWIFVSISICFSQFVIAFKCCWKLFIHNYFIIYLNQRQLMSNKNTKKGDKWTLFSGPRVIKLKSGDHQSQISAIWLVKFEKILRIGQRL